MDSIQVKFHLRNTEVVNVFGAPYWFGYPGDVKISALVGSPDEITGGIARPQWCSKPRMPAETLICKHPDLVAADLRLNALFRKAVSVAAADQIKQEQEAWLRERNRCLGNYFCVNNAYATREQELLLIVRGTEN